MHIEIGIEGEFEGKYIAWALDYPGCFGTSDDQDEAILQFPYDFLAYQGWVNFKAGSDSWLRTITDFDIRLVEVFKVYHVDQQYRVSEEGEIEVNAWFQKDWQPLTGLEIDRAIKMLDWSRKDLLDLYHSISAEYLNQTPDEKEWSIAKTFKHVATAEWWYLTRLNLTDDSYADLPRDTLERMEMVRKDLITRLPALEGKELVLGKRGEFWSPRKLIRRALWHEKHHLVHIQSIRQRMA